MLKNQRNHTPKIHPNQQIKKNLNSPTVNDQNSIKKAKKEENNRSNENVKRLITSKKDRRNIA